jgi:fluoride exporter
MKPFLLIGTGSAIGGICRYLVQILVGKYAGVAFPAGTLLVNLSGCLLIGLLYGLADRYAWMSMEWRLLLMTGICGGYTTFSSFSLEAVSLLRQGSYVNFLLYVFGSVALGLIATAVGIFVIR